MWRILFFKATAASRHAGGGGAGEGVEVNGDAGVRGVPRLSRNELKMFHEQTVSRNEATR